MKHFLALFYLAIAIPSPTWAVGLGPLAVSGIIDGPREGFSLNIYNPYRDEVFFVIYAVGVNDEKPQGRVAVLPAEVGLGPLRGQQILVIAEDLAVSEVYQFRVCAQRRAPPEGSSINARVCSKITAHRVA